MIAALLVVATGCQKHAPIARTPVTALPPPSIGALDHADEMFASANYSEAERSYQNYLQLFPEGSLRDQALFRLGLTRTLQGTPGDWTGATAAFKQLIDEFPQSPMRPVANLVLSLHAQVAQLNADAKLHEQRLRQLNTELDKLKQIDAERRKKPRT